MKIRGFLKDLANITLQNPLSYRVNVEHNERQSIYNVLNSNSHEYYSDLDPYNHESQEFINLNNTTNSQSNYANLVIKFPAAKKNQYVNILSRGCNAGIIKSAKIYNIPEDGKLTLVITVDMRKFDEMELIVEYLRANQVEQEIIVRPFIHISFESHFGIRCPTDTYADIENLNNNEERIKFMQDLTNRGISLVKFHDFIKTNLPVAIKGLYDEDRDTCNAIVGSGEFVRYFNWQVKSQGNNFFSVTCNVGDPRGNNFKLQFLVKDFTNIFRPYNLIIVK